MKTVKEIAQEYGFELIERGSDQILVAKDTDGNSIEWLTFHHIGDSTKALTIYGNTDQANLWFHETREDLTALKLIEFGLDVSEYINGEKRPELLSSLVDPEDWQEIAGVQDAHADERYCPNSINEEEIFNCDECEYHECFDCPIALGQEVAIYTFGKGE